MDVRALARTLPSAAPPSVAIADAGLHTNCTEIEGFVAPELTTLSEPSASAATLISAPAAAGKSTCATAIASVCNAAYLDLAGRLVGDGSFSGLLDLGFGETAGYEFRKKLKAGEVTLVIDALDETQVRSGETAFVQFLKSICWYLRTSAGAANIVMLARQDTSEYVRSTFAEEGIPLREYALEYFDRHKSLAFIDRKLDLLYEEKKVGPAHRQHVANFQKARDALIEAIATAIGVSQTSDPWENPEARRLLGYSPVLEGLAGYLCVSDFRALSVTSTQDEGSMIGGWDVLTDLLLGLLEREQGKFLNAWPDSIEKPIFADAAELQNVYTPREQCRHLVSRLLKIHYDVDLGSVPPSLHTSYRDAIESQLNDHPLKGELDFVNTLFRDFAISVVLTEGSNEVTARSATLTHLRSNTALATPGTGSFILALTADNAIHGDLFDVVISSLTSREDQNERYVFIAEMSGDSPYLSVGSSALGGEKPSSGGVTRALAAPSTLTMPPRPRNIIVNGAREVVFPASVVRLGPNVDVSAEIITFKGGNDLHILTEGLHLDAQWVIADWSQRVIPDDAEFKIACDEADGWVTRYKTDRPSTPQDSNFDKTVNAFIKVMKRFRSTQHTSSGDVQADRSELDNIVMKNDTKCAEVFDALRAGGWIETRSMAYMLSGEFLTSLDTTLVSIRRSEFSPALVEFLHRFDEPSGQ